ncbi:MAG: Gfo/Idh/MocA family oxidoreductase [Clostridia bacterium]|nr:Gfo/Idh/MocA family oxidoreductase [Clostridia bacterium]
MGRVFTASIIGCGSRGATIYGNKMFHKPERFKLVSLCDIDTVVLNRYSKEWNVAKENCFTDENEFFKEKRSDILVIATQDRDHVRMCNRALELGYEILMEKPISPLKSELEELLETHKKYPRNVVVCHVLRYSPAFVKIKELLDSKVIGDLKLIEWAEQVEWWHQAHSFVRGNWRREDETSPMIMQKCCHDFDLMQYYVGSKCEQVFSQGELTFFNEKNKPEGSADRCFECKFRDTCTYSAEKIYIDLWHKMGCPKDEWPFNVLYKEYPLTEEKIREAYKNNQYGRCAFKCDNDVVDYQQCLLKFENGVSISHTMTAFTEQMGRKITFHGTLGEIKFDDANKTLSVCVFGKDKVVYDVTELIRQFASDGFGHGGGDTVLINTLCDMIENGAKAETTLEASVESHLMALAAEESRKTGKIVKIHE